MSTPNPEIYAVEDHLEKAVSAWLAANGINDVKKQRDDTVDFDGKKITLKTPRVEVKFLNGGFTREHYYINPAGERFLDIFDGTFYLKIVTRRDNAEISHSQLRGLCRYLMQKVSEITGRMTLHQIAKLRESASTVSFDADKIHDVSGLSFEAAVQIRPNAFPQS